MVPDYSVAIEELYPSDPVVVMLGMASGTYSRDGKLTPKTAGKPPSPSAHSSKTAWWPSGASTPTTTQSAR